VLAEDVACSLAGGVAGGGMSSWVEVQEERSSLCILCILFVYAGSVQTRVLYASGNHTAKGQGARPAAQAQSAKSLLKDGIMVEFVTTILLILD
jgi:hypothetical protein